MKTKKYYFIVAAAGIGKRMNLDYPKQFLEYNDKPIFINVLETIQNSELVDKIIIVTNSEYISKVKEISEEYNIDKLIGVVPGGEERQDSIYNALNIIHDEDSIIAIQDGVRPFIEESFINSSYEVLTNIENIDGIVIGVKVNDTIKVIDDEGYIKDTLNREMLIAAQTPQIFKAKVLKEAYEKAYEDKYIGTDDSSLVERIGGRVKIMEGSYRNIKITTQEDLKYLD